MRFGFLSKSGENFLLIFFASAWQRVSKYQQDLTLETISFMPLTIAQKLKIKEGSTLLALNAPPDFKKNLQPLPPGVKITDTAVAFDQVHWFVKDQEQMEKELKKSVASDKSRCYLLDLLSQRKFQNANQPHEGQRVGRFT